ncbi:CD99 antigen isoform X4 [Amia ocellicauda]|uniref:CD99 antigen isoform X4 n=1 Tax=Amia ocellicauda TaxID=2972642 RepID=UPI0034638F52
MLFLRIVFLASLTGAALAQDFHLGDALDDFGGPTKPPTPKPKPPQNPGGGTFDLGDAFGGPATTKPPPPPPKKPAGDDFSLDDALGGGSDPYKPPVKPPKDSGTGGGSFGDDDLFNAAGGEYTPDKGHGGAGAGDSTHGGAEEPQDLAIQWSRLLKFLNANAPDSLRVWINNLKQVVAPLVERALEMLNLDE